MPMAPVPITTTSSPRLICEYCTTPFHAPLNGSAWQAASKLMCGGFLKIVFAPVSVYSAKLPCQTSVGPSPPVVYAFSQ